MESASVEPKTTAIDKLNLRWLPRLLGSSVGRKFVMGITGLMLCGFLVVHLAGNLFLYAGRKAFDGYAHKLHEWELLPVLEAGLLLLFLMHVYLAFVTTRENRRARRQAYLVKDTKQTGRVLSPPAHNWMFISGAIILGFTLLHLVDLRIGLRFDTDAEKEPYLAVVTALSDPLSRVVYVVGTLILGVHLSHGVASAFQSLGLSHPKYTPLVKAAGVIFAVVIAVGFCSLPLLVPSLSNAAPGINRPPSRMLDR